MSQLFHVARGDSCVGQFSTKEILGRVQRGELDPFDHVFDEAANDWIAIIVHPIFAAETDFWNSYRHQNVAKPKKLSEAIQSIEQRGKNDPAEMVENGQEAWFVLKGDHRFGPFDYLELIRMLQDHSVSDWDFVWTKRLTKWMRLSSLPEFQPEAIKGLRMEMDEKLSRRVNEVFFRRRFARAPFEGSILIHDNKRLFKGRSMEMGAGGLAIQINSTDATLKVGDQIHLHVKPSAETPAFNSACDVMSSRPVSSGDPQSPVVYGLKFIGLEERVRNEIDGWATRKKSGDAA